MQTERANNEDEEREQCSSLSLAREREGELIFSDRSNLLSRCEKWVQ